MAEQRAATTERNAYWDNIKATLMLLVVVGHFIIPVQNTENGARLIFLWIYLFHMPAFVFVSGYFSKGYARRNTGNPDKLVGFLILYLIFQFLIWVVNCGFSGKFSSFPLFSAGTAPWYMLCMFFWYLVIPYYVSVGKYAGLMAAVIMGLLIGTDHAAGTFLSISRCVVFFPFFVAGFYYDKTDAGIKNNIRRVKKGLSTVFLIGTFFVLRGVESKITPFLAVIYADKSYNTMNISNQAGIVYRLIWYIICCLFIVALLIIVPERKLFFTVIGQRTMGIYIVHRLLRDVFKHIGVYNHLGSGKLLLVQIVVISVCVLLFSSFRGFQYVFNLPFKLHIAEKTGRLKSKR